MKTTIIISVVITQRVMCSGRDMISRQFLTFPSEKPSARLVTLKICVGRPDKEREHAAALEVLPDLLHELDQMPPRPRLTSLIQGILAGNIFDWGAKATVDLYHNGTILEIYR